MAIPSVELKSNSKSAVIELLNARLADSIDLALLTKQAHWNLKGQQFIAVHEMLDPFRPAIDTHTDVIAERVAQLDGIALGTSQVVAASTSLPAYPTQLANQIREDIDTVEEAGDPTSADILTAFSRELDKDLWFLKSHLE
ncbi:MAG: dps [Devosia sp.]|nr:dps [Devosia sp.]